MGWGNVLKQGFMSVGDDIARSQMGQKLASGMIDDVAGEVSRNIKNISADEAAAIIAQAQDDAAKWYASYTANVGKVPSGMNPILYNVGRGAGYTTNVAKQAAPGIAMNAAFMAPMFLPYLMQPSQQEEEQYYE